jgi:hypothetical protein
MEISLTIYQKSVKSILCVITTALTQKKPAQNGTVAMIALGGITIRLGYGDTTERVVKVSGLPLFTYIGPGASGGYCFDLPEPVQEQEIFPET